MLEAIQKILSRDARIAKMKRALEKAARAAGATRSMAKKLAREQYDASQKKPR
jgi:hypothetical protein